MRNWWLNSRIPNSAPTKHMPPKFFLTQPKFPYPILPVVLPPTLSCVIQSTESKSHDHLLLLMDWCIFLVPEGERIGCSGVSGTLHLWKIKYSRKLLPLWVELCEKKCNYFIPRKYSPKSCTLLTLLRGSVSFFCSFCKNPSSIFWDNYTISSHSFPSSKSSHALSPCSLSNSFFSSTVVAWTCMHTHVRVCLCVCFIAEYTVCLMLCVWMFPCWPCGTG